MNNFKNTGDELPPPPYPGFKPMDSDKLPPIAISSPQTYTYPVNNLPVDIETNRDLNNQASLGNNQWGNMSGLSDKVVRIRFIRKVYMILSAQLIFTFGIVAVFVFVEPVKLWARTTAGYTCYIISYVLFFGLIIGFSILQCCNSRFLKKVPYNYFLLLGITLTLTFMLAMVSSYHSIQAVLIAIGITLTVTVGVTIFAIQTKLDFTNCWLLMLCLTLALVGFGIAVAITYRTLPVLQAVYGGLGAVLMSMFLAIDTQMLMGNKRYAFDPEDYINAAVQLYLDVCYMFMYLLQAFGGK